MGSETCVFVTPHINQFGAEKSLVSLVSYVKQQGYEVLVIMPTNGPIVELLEEKEIPYIIERFASIVNYSNRPRYIKGILKRIFNYFKAVKVGRTLGKRNIIFVHTNSIVTDFGVLLSKVLKCDHYQHIREFADLDFNMTFELGKTDLSKIQKASTKIICISKAIENHYKYLGDNLCTIYNGVSLNSYPYVKQTKNNIEFRMVLTGRLGKEKGHYLVLNALEYLDSIGVSNITLDFYGSGDCEEDLKKIVNRKKLTNRVKFCGYTKIIPYNQYDVGLMCSNYEGFGRVTIEYMLAGLPVIGSNSGATPELVHDGKTGLLYKAFDYKALATSIEALEKDRAAAQKMGEEGLKLAYSEFTEKRYLENVTNILFAR